MREVGSKMTSGFYFRLLAAAGSLAMGVPADAGMAQLTLSSQIQYSRVVQGAVEPIFAFVSNTAPPGSDAGAYSVTAAYGSQYSGNFGYSYMGTKVADGGASPTTLPFNLNTTSLNPGTVPVRVTLTNTGTGASLNQGGQFTVLAHAGPALYLQGQIVPLSSKTVITFSTSVFGEASPTGTEGVGGGFNPQLLGDPPGEPTANLDLDSISSIGSPFITTTLAPFAGLPSNDDPAQSVPFQIDFLAPSAGDYSTTFLLNYSDEQDLPGAAPAGSELASFQVDVHVTPTSAFWTVTTDTVPEPGTVWLTLVGCGICLLAGTLRRHAADSAKANRIAMRRSG